MTHYFRTPHPGPPGTGKTETILNLIADILRGIRT